jgi:hypothetical protein
MAVDVLLDLSAGLISSNKSDKRFVESFSTIVLILIISDNQHHIRSFLMVHMNIY